MPALSPVVPGRALRFGLLEVLVASFLASLVIVAFLGPAEGLLCVAASSALVAVSLPVAFRAETEVFEPIWFVLLNVAIGVTGKAFYLSLGKPDQVDFLLMGLEPKDLLPTAMLIAVGFSFFSAGYLSGTYRWRLPNLEWLQAERWKASRFWSVVCLLIVVGVVSAILFASRVDVSIEQLSDISAKRFVELEGTTQRGSQGYLRWGAAQLELAFYLVLLRWAASGRRLLSLSGATVVFLGALAMIFPVFTSSRWAILMLITRILVIWVCLGRRLRLRNAGALFLVALVVMGSMLAFRRNLSEWEGVSAQLGSEALLQATVGRRHFLGLTKTAHIVGAVPEVMEYQYGKTLISWLVTPVPRSVWPGKPPIRLGNTLGPKVFGEGRTGVPPGIVADFYLNFGVAGVWAGLLLCGVFLRSIHATLRPLFPRPGLILIYVLLITRFGLEMPGTSFSGTMARSLQEMVAVSLCLILLSWRAGVARTEQRTGQQSEL